MGVHNIIAIALIGLGYLFMAIAAVGVIKFPDFFTRLHASGVGETFGALMMTLGIIAYKEGTLLSLKVFIIFFILLLTNPLGTNLIMLTSIHAKNYQDYNHKRHVGVSEDLDIEACADADDEENATAEGEVADDENDDLEEGGR